jgi:hypothetical protein
MRYCPRTSVVTFRSGQGPEFATLRLRLLQIAGRVIEMASRVRLAFAATYPEAELFARVPGALMPSGP